MAPIYSDIKKILIINLGGIGDFLLSTPALRALKKLYPAARIDFLGVSRTCGLAEKSGFFADVVPFEAYDERRRVFDVMRLLRTLRFLARLRKQKYDMILNMRTLHSWPGAFKVALLVYAIGAVYRVGRDTSGRGFFFNVKIKEGGDDKHEMDYDVDTVAALGAQVADVSFDAALFFDAAARDRMEDMLRGFGITPSEPLIFVNAGGAPSHRWPEKNFREVLGILVPKFSAVGVIIGGAAPQDRQRQKPVKADSRIIDLKMPLTLAELAYLIKRSRLFITNDTGPMHIAAILKTPMVAIFGPGYLTRYDPRRISERTIVLYKKAWCAPCLKMRCDSMRCLEDIRPQDVVAGAEALLEKTGNA